MKKILALMVAAMMVGGLSGTALARGGGTSKHHKATFETMDTNGDGKISSDEFKVAHPSAKHPEKLQARFDRIDTDHDGFITKAEWAAKKTLAKHHKKNGMPTLTPPPSGGTPNAATTGATVTT